MVNIEMLKSAMEASGMKVTAIAEKSGICRETLYNRLNGVGEFRLSEIVGLTDALQLSDAQRDQIFFSN